MAISLYELAGANTEQKFSPHCWKSHLALNHQKLPFVSLPVRYHEIKAKLNFADYSLLPVLADDGRAVVDSWNIACYLDELPSTRPLFASPADKALAESINHWCDTTLALHIRPLILLSVYKLLHEDDKAYFRESREKKLGMSLEKFSEKAEAALIDLDNELDSVRDIIAMQPYIGGKQPSYADICLLSTFLWVACVSDIPFLKEGDIVFAWYQRMLDAYPEAKAAVSSV